MDFPELYKNILPFAKLKLRKNPYSYDIAFSLKLYYLLVKRDLRKKISPIYEINILVKVCLICVGE